VFFVGIRLTAVIVGNELDADERRLIGARVVANRTNEVQRPELSYLQSCGVV
jgi:hypothetical protein